MAKWVAQGCEVTYVLCTNGGAGTADRSLTPAELTARRADEQRAAADFMGVRHVVMLGYPDGGLEDTRDFLGDVVRAIRRYRPDTVFVHDPYRMKSFQHRDHRKAGIVTTDAIYPFARDHLHFPEHVEQEGLEPHKVRELWYWGADQPDVIVDVTDSIDRQIAALVRHESQMPGFNVPDERHDRRAREAPGRRAGGGLRLHVRRGVPATRRPAIAPEAPDRQRSPRRRDSPDGRATPVYRRLRRARGEHLGEAGERARPALLVAARHRRGLEAGLREHDLGSALRVLELDGHQGLDGALLLPLVREGHLLVRDDLPVLAVGDVAVPSHRMAWRNAPPTRMSASNETMRHPSGPTSGRPWDR